MVLKIVNFGTFYCCHTHNIFTVKYLRSKVTDWELTTFFRNGQINNVSTLL